MEFLLGLVVALLLVIAAGGVLAYRKLAAKLLNLKESRTGALNMHFRQLEALGALYYRLRPVIPLPPTRGWAASPDFLLTIANFVLDRRPSVIVECSSGVSTLVAARCAQLGGRGHVFSLEHEPEFAAKTRQLLTEHGLSSFATVIDAPLVETTFPHWSGKWYDYKKLFMSAPIDLLVIDGPPHFCAKRARYPAVPAFFEKLAGGAVILLDDADRTDEQATTRLWLEHYRGLRSLTLPECEKGCKGFIRNDAVAGPL